MLTKEWALAPPLMWLTLSIFFMFIPFFFFECPQPIRGLPYAYQRSCQTIHLQDSRNLMGKGLWTHVIPVDICNIYIVLVMRLSRDATVQPQMPENRNSYGSKVLRPNLLGLQLMGGAT